MSIHHAETDRSIISDSKAPMAKTFLADSSLSDLYAAKNTMSSPAVPGEFGNLVIDMGDRHRSESKMAAAETRQPTVSGPGCEFKISRVPTADMTDEPEVEVKPPKDGGSCVVVMPPKDNSLDSKLSDY